ncbi:hypothetical protein HDE_07850 [Halotydeus destructor]|nr:hypothetical protein HDE_07850 [Halotydeus destructor]
MKVLCLLLVCAILTVTSAAILNSDVSLQADEANRVMKHFQDIRSRMEQLGQAPIRGPSTDIGEWLETVTSVARQLPVVQQTVDSIETQVRIFDQNLGLSRLLATTSQGGIVFTVTQLERLNEVLDGLIRVLQQIGAIAHGRAHYQASDTSRQEDILIEQLNPIGRIISTVVEGATILRENISFQMNHALATASRLGGRRRRQAPVIPGGLPTDFVSARSIQALSAMVRTFSRRVAALGDVLSKFVANYVAILTEQSFLSVSRNGNINGGPSGPFPSLAGIRSQVHDVAVQGGPGLTTYE